MTLALFVSLLPLTTPICFAHGGSDEEHAATDVNGQEGPMLTGHHASTHPFLVHMGLPDGPGEASVRLTEIQRAGPQGRGSDQAIHIEAGLVDRLGIHLRNDAISGAAMGSANGMREEHGTEIMLMYALFQNADATRGISIFSEVAWPTTKGDAPSLRGAGGLGGTYFFSARVALDAIVHADPSNGDLEVEYEGSLRYRMVRRFFAMLENKGNLGGHGERKHYVMPALKFALEKSNATVGVGVQVPTSKGRDFDRQTLFQLELGF